MDSTTLAAIIGVIGVALGVSVTRAFDFLDRRARHQQWLDEFRLPKQIDTLSTLYADAIELHAQVRNLLLELIYEQGDVATIQEVTTAHVPYEKSRALAYIYLTKQGNEAAAEYGAHVRRSIIIARVIDRANRYPNATKLAPDISHAKLTDELTLAEDLHLRLAHLLQHELAATSLLQNNRNKH